MVKQTKAEHRMGTSSDQPLTRDHAKQVQHEQWIRHQERGGSGLEWSGVSLFECHKINKLETRATSFTRVCFTTTTRQYVNPLTPISDQDIISPYNINTISSR